MVISDLKEISVFIIFIIRYVIYVTQNSAITYIRRNAILLRMPAEIANNREAANMALSLHVISATILRIHHNVSTANTMLIMLAYHMLNVPGNREQIKCRSR